MDVLSARWNNATSSDLARIDARIAELNGLLTTAKQNRDWCRAHPLKSCNNRTGKKLALWKELIRGYESELGRLKNERAEIKSQIEYQTDILTSQAEIDRLKALSQQEEHKQEILEQQEWSERGKKWGLYAVIFGGLALVGVFAYKAIKK